MILRPSACLAVSHLETVSFQYGICSALVCNDQGRGLYGLTVGHLFTKHDVHEWNWLDPDTAAKARPTILYPTATCLGPVVYRDANESDFDAALFSVNRNVALSPYAFNVPPVDGGDDKEGWPLVYDAAVFNQLAAGQEVCLSFSWYNRETKSVEFYFKQSRLIDQNTSRVTIEDYGVGGGSSGAPVMIRGTADWKLVGFVSAGRPDDKGVFVRRADAVLAHLNQKTTEKNKPRVWQLASRENQESWNGKPGIYTFLE